MKPHIHAFQPCSQPTPHPSSPTSMDHIIPSTAPTHSNQLQPAIIARLKSSWLPEEYKQSPLVPLARNTRAHRQLRHQLRKGPC